MLDCFFKKGKGQFFPIICGTKLYTHATDNARWSSRGIVFGQGKKCFTDHALLKYIRIWSFGWGPKIFLYIYIYI